MLAPESEVYAADEAEDNISPTEKENSPNQVESYFE